jgi:hypothetical protein
MKRLLIALLAACTPEDPHTVEWINPSAELRPYFVASLARWEAAGMTPGVIKLTNDGSGRPAYLTSSMPADLHGETMREGGALQYIRIYRDSYAPIQSIVDHEVCHLMGARKRHSLTGLCSTNLLTDVIDDSSLMVACGFDFRFCSHFTPEETIKE